MENGVRTGGRRGDGGAYSGQRGLACQAAACGRSTWGLMRLWVFRNPSVIPAIPRGLLGMPLGNISQNPPTKYPYIGCCKRE